MRLFIGCCFTIRPAACVVFYTLATCAVAKGAIACQGARWPLASPVYSPAHLMDNRLFIASLDLKLKMRHLTFSNVLSRNYLAVNYLQQICLIYTQVRILRGERGFCMADFPGSICS